MEEQSIIPIDFNRLQTLIKGDNYAYRDEFYQHFHHFKALYKMFLQNPSNGNVFISKLALFLSNVVYLYSDVSDEFSYDILFLLKESFTSNKSSFIFTLSKCVVILRNYKVISIDSMIEVFLHLFTHQNKSLRKFIFTQLLFQICKVSSNSSSKHTIQNGFHSQLSQENLLKQYLASELTIELFNRNIWRNEKSVFLLQVSVLSKVRKMSVNAVRFFIRPIYTNSFETSSSGDDFYEISKVGKTKKIQSSMKNAKPKQSEHSFHAIDLVRDPYGFAVNLMKRLESKNDLFEDLMEKMCLMGLLIWTHKLVIPQFYTFLQRYLKPYQQQVTHILTYLSQAVHEFLDINTLEPLVQSIISNFITEQNTTEAITVGLNTVREIALKCPGILKQELLFDLIRYRKFKNKNVVMASRSLLQLYRDVDSKLLPKRDRGKPNENCNNLPLLTYKSGLTDDFIHGVMLLESNNNDQNMETDNKLYDKIENARIISQSRILSQSEHAAIRRKTTQRLLNPTLSNQQLQLNYRLMKDGNDIVTVSDVEYLSKKPKSVDLDNNNLKNRGKIKLKLNSESKFGRNRKKCSNKNFMMVSHGKAVLTKEFKPKKKGFQSKNYKMKRILTKEYNKTRSSL